MASISPQCKMLNAKIQKIHPQVVLNSAIKVTQHERPTTLLRCNGCYWTSFFSFTLVELSLYFFRIAFSFFFALYVHLYYNILDKMFLQQLLVRSVTIFICIHIAGTSLFIFCNCYECRNMIEILSTKVSVLVVHMLRVFE